MLGMDYYLLYGLIEGTNFKPEKKDKSRSQNMITTV